MVPLNRQQRRWALNKPRKNNNRKSNDSRRAQIIWSEPHRILVGSYTTKSGQIKNRYAINPNAKPVKTIIHTI